MLIGPSQDQEAQIHTSGNPGRLQVFSHSSYSSLTYINLMQVTPKITLNKPSLSNFYPSSSLYPKCENGWQSFAFEAAGVQDFTPEIPVPLSHETWFSCGTSNSGSGCISDSFTCFCDPFPLTELLFQSLMRGFASSLYIFLCGVQLISLGRPCLF